MPGEIGFDIIKYMFTVPTGKTWLYIQLRRAIVDDMFQQDAYQGDAVGEHGMVEKDQYAVIWP